MPPRRDAGHLIGQRQRQRQTMGHGLFGRHAALPGSVEPVPAEGAGSGCAPWSIPLAFC